LIEVAFGERERFLNAQPRSPQDRDQGAKPPAMRSVAGTAHDGDDLFDLGRIGRVAQAFVARRVAGVESRHCRWRSTSTGTVEQKLGHDPPRARGRARISAAVDAVAPVRPPRYRFRHRAAVKADPRSVSRLPQRSGATKPGRCWLSRLVDSGGTAENPGDRG
jgi:hypothetical protein